MSKNISHKVAAFIFVPIVFLLLTFFYSIVMTLHLQTTMSNLIQQQDIIDCKIDSLLKSVLISESPVVVAPQNLIDLGLGSIFFLITTLLLLSFASRSAITTDHLYVIVNQEIEGALARYTAAELIAVLAYSQAVDDLVDANVRYNRSIISFERILTLLRANGRDDVANTLIDLVYSPEVVTIVKTALGEGGDTTHSFLNFC